VIRALLKGAHQGRLTVDGPRHHYLVHVLRLRVGDALEVFDGLGQCFAARVLSLEETGAALELGPPRAVPPPRSITVVQGLPKGDKLELVLQKGTELGAACFAPIATTRSVVKLSGREEKKRERWERIAEEAARQCGRADVPEVREPAALGEALAALAHGTVVLVLDEEERAVPLSLAWRELGPSTPVALLVGPEGGLTREEVAQAQALGARAVTLGRLKLRTETAALAALAVARHLDGELG
jgi:16S rRNA (uracil1498-N3)-methyltransferase